MEIVVCIKQVPDTTDVKINPQTNTLVRDGIRTVMNPFDDYAVEEGVRLRERYGGRVTLITMGPPQARQALEEGLAMGADDAVLVTDRAFAGSDTLVTSYILAHAINRRGNVDLVICGKQAADGDTAQVGPEIAVNLSIPQVAFVKSIRSIEGRSIVVERRTDAGFDVVATQLPCVLTVIKEINVPRYASFAGKARAKRTNIVVWGQRDLGCEDDRIGLDGSPTWVDHIFTPPVRHGGTPVEATDEHIQRVADDLNDRFGGIWGSR